MQGQPAYNREEMTVSGTGQRRTFARARPVNGPEEERWRVVRL